MRPGAETSPRGEAIRVVVACLLVRDGLVALLRRSNSVAGEPETWARPHSPGRETVPWFPALMTSMGLAA